MNAKRPQHNFPKVLKVGYRRYLKITSHLVPSILLMPQQMLLQQQRLVGGARTERSEHAEYSQQRKGLGR